MSKLYDNTKENIERAVLIGVYVKSNIKRGDDIKIEDSMKELEELAQAAGAEVILSAIQNKEAIDKAYYAGKGKIEELRDHIQGLDATVLIFNDELSGAQIRNIEEVVGIKVIDRTTLILDIFAQRAHSAEGKLQVELAQLRYRLPRLYGMGGALSRQGAGIGTRGPGEQKLEKDKRHILTRMDSIRKELKAVKKIRETQRTQRTKNKIPVVALVGYTNAGKSTLLNKLISTHAEFEPDKEVFVKDMLFATLDVTLRRAVLPNKKEFLVVDTVGFVSKLPHDLVEAFKATLEEVKFADLILHVVDVTNESYELQMSTTEQVLKELEAGDKKQITVYNKVDRLNDDSVLTDKGEDVLYISAKQGINMDKLLKKIEEKLFEDMYKVKLLLPYDKGDLFSKLQSDCIIKNFEYTGEGIEVEATLDKDYFRICKSYLV